MDKKAELEAKKAKLEAMKRKKIEMAKAADINSTSSMNSIAEPTTLNVDPEKILIECGITTPVLLSNPSSSSLTTSVTSLNNEDSSLQHHLIPGQSKAFAKNKKPVKLSTNVVNSIDIPPRENVTYSKETQTPSTDIALDKDAKPLDYYVLTYDNIDDDETTSLDAVSTGTSTQTQTNRTNNNKNKNQKNRNDSTSSANNEKIDSQLVDDIKNIDDRVKMLQIKEMSEEERNRLLQSEEFLSFFTRNTKILEKALDQEDIFFEYGAADKNSDLIETGQAFKLNKEFYDERWKNRIVTWLDWSPLYPELLLASYEDSAVDTDGIALVWNSKFKTTSPEFIFNCSSWVTSCCFARFHPNLIIGGTYSGQIVMWDNRSNKRTPIQRSSLSAASHTHPVHCIQVVGSQNAHNLISISNDGKLCSWTLDNMNTPQETLELQCKQTKQVAVTTMGFRAGDVNNFVVGSEEGPIYTATRHGNKSGINESFEGHFGPVTGLSCHQVQGPIDFSHTFLTSSFDWTVKLWNLKEPGKPIYSFENNSDYVYDVQWSPTHPALFACVDGTGRLDLWNLINDSEQPTASLLVDGAPALNKLRWNQSGHQIAVGDDQGKISIYDVNEAYANPRSDDWTKFVRVLSDLKQSSSEMDESISNSNVSNVNQAMTTPSMSSSNLSSSNLLQSSQMSPILPSVKSEPNFEYRTPMLSANSYTSPPSTISQTLMSQLKQSPVTPK